MTIGLRPHSLARRAFRKTLAKQAVPCSAEQFRALVEYERLRTDRNGSPFALVLVSFAPSLNPAEDGAALASLLDRRLRVTDEIGWWDGQTLGILLTDTDVSGAEHVVDDIQRLAAGQVPAFCRVSFYPADGGSADDGDPLPRHAKCVTADSGESSVAPPIELLLARRMPWWKRGMDIVGALVGLVLLAPLLILVAILIKLTSRGPVFFRQVRDGWGGRRFVILKFRTMYVDAEARKAALLAQSEQDGPAFKLRNDPRMTWLGRYLRRSCVDELPQLWHVLWGEMSLVGPRPLDSAEARHCKPWQRRRHTVTPGLTCTWQARGKGLVPFDDWMRMDLRYVKAPSLWEDVKLIWATLIAVILHRASH